MVHANIKLVLEHSGSLIAHISKSFSSLLHLCQIHEPKYPQTYHKPYHDPQNEELLPPCFPHLSRDKVVIVDVGSPGLERELLWPYQRKIELDLVKKSRFLFHYASINEPSHGFMGKMKEI
jgi:hypothetical protein